MNLYFGNNTLCNINLQNEITRGGEGKIIDLNKNQVAKIYLPDIEPIEQKKFEFLQKINSPFFIKPQNLLYDKRQQVKGFVMTKLPPNNVPLDSLFSGLFCQKNNLTSKKELEICKILINEVENIHKFDIVIGDLNPLNILIDIDDDFKPYFIDVDSYQIPGIKHSGIMYEGIRDYVYNNIDEKSDYFALAILIFNLLTKVHPYKGIHKKYKKIADRIKFNLSVLNKDNDLIIPKFYRPIQNKYLLDQFKKIFIDGERFPISIDPQNFTFYKKQKISKILSDKLSIMEINVDNILELKSNLNNLIVKTKFENVVFDVSNKGYFKENFRINNDNELYPGLKNILNINNNNISVYKDKNWINIENVDIKNSNIITQLENQLLVINSNQLEFLSIDEIIQKNIRIRNKSVYVNGFKNYNGLIHHIDGNSYIQHIDGNNFNEIKFPFLIEDIYQNDNIGVVKYKDQNDIKYKFFKIEGLSIILDSEEQTRLLKFGYNKNKFIIKPDDDYLTVLDTNFNELTKFECSVSTSDSEVYYTNAGIILYNGDKIYLINTK